MQKLIIKAITYIACAIALVFSAGCESVNSRLGKDSMNYTCAKELPPLKLPPEALAVSTRYDIPEIPSNKNPIITDPAPPEYANG